jgi:zinc transport system substrate-binding protein
VHCLSAIGRLIGALVAGVLAMSWLTTADAAPRVVVSILPVYSLVADVMQGVGQPALIVRGYGSPHTYQMRPSDAAALAHADIVFWIGESMETFLSKPLSALAGEAHVVTLMDIKGMRLLPNRTGGLWQVAGGSHGAARDEDEHGHFNPHIWLDVDNAKRMVTITVHELSTVDPANTARYRTNGARLTEGIEQLDRELRQMLLPARGIPYLVFHDAFQYMEERYGLDVVGAVTISPERLPSAKHLQELREAIKRLGVRCVFREPEFQSPLVATVIEDSGARLAVLDPLGASLAPGPDLYIRMMRANATALVDCLVH